jgi:glyoxylase-like metal-dependent hydrolase (beta-lactamase superfamily II)
MSSTEIADGVFVISIPMSEHLDTAVVALRGAELVLVDAGIPVAGPDALRQFASRHDCGSVGAVLCTHFHRDHTGGIAELREQTPFDVYAHVAEGHLIAEPGDFARAMAMNSSSPPPPASVGTHAIGVLDGFRLPVGGREWEAIHVPGHTWGHLAFWSESDRILITGDSIQGEGIPYYGVPGQGTGLPYYLDAGAYRRSLQRMQSLSPELLVISHEVPPWGARVLRSPSDIADAFDSSLQETDRIEQLVRSRLADVDRATLQDVAAFVCSASGMVDVTAQAILTVRAHLVELGTDGVASVHQSEWSMTGEKSA